MNQFIVNSKPSPEKVVETCMGMSLSGLVRDIIDHPDKYQTLYRKEADKCTTTTECRK